MENDEKKKKEGNLTFGLILIIIGAILLIGNYVPAVSFDKLWPLVLIAVGAGLLLKNRKE